VWCDTFDLDLARVLPEAIAIVARIPDRVELRTFGYTTDGRLNHPMVWNTGHGSTAYFTLGSGRPAPPHYVTFDELVTCTFTEAIRDCWVHGYVIVVDGAEIWDGVEATRRWFQPLLYHHRRWIFLSGPALRRIEQQVCASLADATRRLERLVARRAPGPRPAPTTDPGQEHDDNGSI
jgi:hypothetical protein